MEYFVLLGNIDVFCTLITEIAYMSDYTFIYIVSPFLFIMLCLFRRFFFVSYSPLPLSCPLSTFVRFLLKMCKGILQKQGWPRLLDHLAEIVISVTSSVEQQFLMTCDCILLIEKKKIILRKKKNREKSKGNCKKL